MNNSFRIALTVVSFASVIFIVVAANAKLTNLEDNIERVRVESIVSSGKAIYMPGNVCVLKATSDVSTYWTGPSTDEENRVVPFIEKGILGLLNGGTWLLIEE